MTRRYPYAPLAAAMGLSEHQAAIKLGLSGSTEQTYRQRGVTDRVGDRLAVKAGLHPVEVWGEDFGLPLCERPACRRPFIPSVGTQRFCHRRCSQAEWKRQRRATDPEFAQRLRDADATYRTECSTYVLAAGRARHHADADRRNAQRRARYRANRDAELERQRRYDLERRAKNKTLGVNNAQQTYQDDNPQTAGERLRIVASDAPPAPARPQTSHGTVEHTQREDTAA